MPVPPLSLLNAWTHQFHVKQCVEGTHCHSWTKQISLTKVFRHLSWFWSVFQVTGTWYREKILAILRKCHFYSHFWCGTQGTSASDSQKWVRQPSWINPLSWGIFTQSDGFDLKNSRFVEIGDFSCRFSSQIEPAQVTARCEIPLTLLEGIGLITRIHLCAGLLVLGQIRSGIEVNRKGTSPNYNFSFHSQNMVIKSQMLPCWTEDSSPYITMWDIVAKVVPLCSVYQVP